MAVKPLYSRHQQCNASHIQEHQESFAFISILMSAGSSVWQGDYPFVIADLSQLFFVY